MTFKKYLICITAIGIFSACGDQVETKENYPNPSTPYEALSFKTEDLEIYEIQTQEDFDQILSLSKKLNKPVLLYFTGLNIVSYNKFEKKIWPDPLVYPILKNEFLIAAVYVDDRTNFPDIHIDNPPETYGEYWLEYEAEKYNMSTQPIFDILNHQNESLVTGIATVRSHGTPELYSEWLKEGLANFKKQNIP